MKMPSITRGTLLRYVYLLVVLDVSVACLGYGMAWLRFSKTSPDVARDGVRGVRGAVLSVSSSGIGAHKNFRVRVQGSPEQFIVSGKLLNPDPLPPGRGVIDFEERVRLGDEVWIDATGGVPYVYAMYVVRDGKPQELMNGRVIIPYFISEIAAAGARGWFFAVLGPLLAVLGLGALYATSRVPALSGAIQKAKLDKWMAKPAFRA